MALIGGIFTSVTDAEGNPDRAVDEEYWDEYHKSFLTNGVYPSPADSFLVRAGSGMTLTVRPGACFVNGKYAYDKAEASVTVPPAGASVRRDRVVLRLDVPERRFVLAVKTGGAAAPAPARSGNVWELGLAVVYVAPGTAEITQAEVTDTRADSSVCGWVTAPLHEVNFAGLEAQCLRSFQAFMQLIQGKLGDDPAASLQNQVNQKENPNLLINSDFRVHQRGERFVYDAGKGQYTADRWMIYCALAYSPYLTVTCGGEGGLTIANGNPSGKAECYLQYYLEKQDLASLRGHKVGITYGFKDRKEYELKEIIPTHTSQLLINSRIEVPAGKSVTLSYVKAEFVDDEASKSTVAAYVTPYSPRTYAQELADCRRYYQAAENIHIPQTFYDGLRPNFEYYFPVPMRAAPAMKYKTVGVHDATNSLFVDGGSWKIGEVDSHRIVFFGGGFRSDGLLSINGAEFDAEIYG